MVPIGEWVLDTACRDWAQWRAMGLEPGRIAVNVSGRQLKYGGFAATVARTLLQHGLDSGELELEITESVAMDEDCGMVERCSACASWAFICPSTISAPAIPRCPI